LASSGRQSFAKGDRSHQSDFVTERQLLSIRSTSLGAGVAKMHSKGEYSSRSRPRWDGF
jgi:hypothetical protein